jgi:hypothetical protein
LRRWSEFFRDPEQFLVSIRRTPRCVYRDWTITWAEADSPADRPPSDASSAASSPRPRPFLPGDHVTTEQGTGLVHMAPDHGEEDFLVCKKVGIDPVFAVTDDGRYRDNWLWLGRPGLGDQREVQRARRADQ